VEADSSMHRGTDGKRKKGRRRRYSLLLSVLVPAVFLSLAGCGSGSDNTLGSPGASGDAGAVSGVSSGGSGNGSENAGNGSGSDQDGSAVSSTWKPRTAASDLRLPEASGSMTDQNADGSVVLDYSHTDNGYIMLKDTNDKKVQVQITNPSGDVYPYPLKEGGDYETFPLTGGDGSYSIRVLENISGDQYAIALADDFSVTLQDEFQPFLYPNQSVYYTADSEVTALGEKLAGSSKSDLAYVEAVYNYVIQNITYDEQLAESTPVNYIPDPDETLQKGTGICYDYASLMAALLRSQSVPTKLVTGYSGKAYHAWVSVYLQDKGWVDGIIYFDGKNWTLMDPTLGANNDSKAVAKYVGDGSNYTEKYEY